MAELLVERGDQDEALALLARIPETADSRRVAAMARLGAEASLAQGSGNDIEQRLDALLNRVKADEEARQEFLDLLETMGPEDPRTTQYRKALTTRLF
jgi:putative thioredoxin